MDTSTWSHSASASSLAQPEGCTPVDAHESATDPDACADRLLERRIDHLNAALAGASAAAIVKRALALAERPMLSSSFGPDSAALIRLVMDERPDVPVVWVDTGHHTHATHRFVASLAREWDLDLRIYRPLSPVDVPAAGSTEHKRFAERVKLAPFKRALEELRPDVWLTGIRAEETAHRASVPTVSRGPNGIIKVAPLRQWHAARTAAFLHARELPNGHDYHDVVKGSARSECGLHDRL